VPPGEVSLCIVLCAFLIPVVFMGPFAAAAVASYRLRVTGRSGKQVLAAETLVTVGATNIREFVEVATSNFFLHCLVRFSGER